MKEPRCTFCGSQDELISHNLRTTIAFLCKACEEMLTLRSSLPIMNNVPASERKTPTTK